MAPHNMQSFGTGFSRLAQCFGDSCKLLCISSSFLSLRSNIPPRGRSLVCFSVLLLKEMWVVSSSQQFLAHRWGRSINVSCLLEAQNGGLHFCAL